MYSYGRVTAIDYANSETARRKYNDYNGDNGSAYVHTTNPNMSLPLDGPDHEPLITYATEEALIEGIAEKKRKHLDYMRERRENLRKPAI